MKQCNSNEQYNQYNQTSTRILIDSAGILKPKPLLQYVKRYIDITDLKRFGEKCYICDANNMWIKRSFSNAYCTQNVETFCKYITRTTGQLYVKMLAVIDSTPSSYDDIWLQVLKPRGISQGNDKDSFSFLEKAGLMELDHFGKHRRKFYKTTPLGKLVLETAKKNDVAYKVLRHFMTFKGDFDAHMIDVSLNPETMFDMDPKSLAACIEAILIPSSCLHEIGSQFYWCNKLLDCLKKSSNVFGTFNCAEVNDWLEAHASEPNVQRFLAVWHKLEKKHAKAAA